jgi:hypothetical protein
MNLTFLPLISNASANSTPIYPAPTIATFLIFLSFAFSIIS